MASRKDKETSQTDFLLEEYAPILKNLIRYSSAVNAKDISFYKSIDPAIKEKANDISSDITDTMNDVLMSALTVSTDDTADIKFKINSESENNQVLSNVLDTLLEKVEINLDNHYKAKKNKHFQSSSSNQRLSSTTDDGYTYLDQNENVSSSSSTVPRGGANMEKPQTKFLTPVDNFETTPFKPLIKFKPNAIKPLQESLQLAEPTDEIPLHYENPYAYEIMNAEYPEWILNSVPENEKYESIPWVGSPEAQWIDSPEKLDSLLVELNKCKVIAIDLEHHDYRTYHGLTSLMQITSDSKVDYLIDPLSPTLRPHLTTLNEVFTNPNIIKVLHGAFMDVIWLQRDLGLYLVSLFDTFHAAKQLALGKYSLAFLLEEYAKFRTSKKWQLADWRIRPLSAEMKDYAKADTHFLIEIFYKMHEDLLKIPNALQKALYASRKVAVRRFEYSTYRPKNLSMSSNSEVVSTSGSVPLLDEITKKITLSYDKDLPWTNLIYSNGIPLERRPLLEVLFKWRDNQARFNDESPRYIMSDFILVSLANNFQIGHESAVDVNSVMAVINKHSKFGGSYHVRKLIKELTDTIKTAVTELKGVDLNKLQALSNGNEGGNNTSEELVPGTNYSSTDINGIYSSVKDVSKLQEQFTSFYQLYNQTISNNNKPIKIDTIDDNNEDAVFAVKYSKQGKATVVKNVSVKDRINKVVGFFTEDMGKDVEFTVEAEDDEEENGNDQQEADNDNGEASKNENEINPRDEIITLRRKRSERSNGSKRKANTLSEVEDLSVDFSKSIMEKESNDRSRFKKQKKKPSFDPYSNDALADMNIPQLKKKQRVDRGKNVVFKQNKK
ncbi:hypothetical protein PMKS-003836 [Pichia membranifaciens]|uniref:HRDC domain-containing protein n=1 Tax=Pichia membranifaciens TaxID=4926 RepID=A0A1Q2YLA1_9ASCO|nr:hypothetical protein PMKS-003836 [Pichia membranifaciens]